MKDGILEILKEVTDAIVRHQSVQDILQRTTALVCQYLQIDVCTIYTHDPSAKSLNLTAASGFDNQPQDVSLKDTEGITGLSFQTHDILNIVAPQNHPAYKHIPVCDTDKYKSLLAIPMLTGQTCVGVLNIQSVEEEPAHDDIVDFVSTLATQLAMMMSNASSQEIFKDHSNDLHKEHTTKVPRTSSNSLNQSHTGAAISPGVVAGPAYLLQTDALWSRVTHKITTDIPSELEALERALEKARAETIVIQKRATRVFIEADASIFFAQLMFLEDPNFVSDIRLGIQEKSYDALCSVKATVEKYIAKFESSNNPQLAERALDLKDVGLRIMQQLIDNDTDSLPDQDKKMVLVGQNIMPSDFMRIPTEKLLGIICATGGSTSHAAILARSLAIPAVMGVKNIFSNCKNDDHILIDGTQGIVFINPNHETMGSYRNSLETEKHEVSPEELASPCVSADGTPIELQGNISMISDINTLNTMHNSGVGLYRTEFMFMIHDNFPLEAEQYRIYRRIEKMNWPKSVTIRALDIGGDKPLRYFKMDQESDPMLGWRSIRVLLDKPEIFRPQIRAILRASQRGTVRMLFPMINHIEDILAVKEAVSRELADLRAHYGEKFICPPLGAMIETPSALMQLDEILEEVDFVSIGTNDLVQYMFAVDRGNSLVQNYFKPMHPIILKALKQIISRANHFGKDVSICGEISGDPLFLPLLLGLGLKKLSMPPFLIHAVKVKASKLKLEDCQNLAEKALALRTEKEVRLLVEDFLNALDV